MSDTGNSARPTQLAAFAFDDDLKAVEFMTAVTRLARERRLELLDAVFVIKDTDGRTHVRETRDPQPGQTAIGAGLWSGLFGLLLGGPVGMLVAGGIGAGAGAITAKVIDIGVTDEFVEQLREMVRPGTTTVALLTDRIDPEPVLEELRRFQGARYVTGNLSLDAIRAVRDALGDPAATTSETSFPPPTPTDPPA